MQFLAIVGFFTCAVVPVVLVVWGTFIACDIVFWKREVDRAVNNWGTYWTPTEFAERLSALEKAKKK